MCVPFPPWAGFLVKPASPPVNPVAGEAVWRGSRTARSPPQNTPVHSGVTPPGSNARTANSSLAWWTSNEATCCHSYTLASFCIDPTMNPPATTLVLRSWYIGAAKSNPYRSFGYPPFSCSRPTVFLQWLYSIYIGGRITMGHFNELHRRSIFQHGIANSASFYPYSRPTEVILAETRRIMRLNYQVSGSGVELNFKVGEHYGTGGWASGWYWVFGWVPIDETIGWLHSLRRTEMMIEEVATTGGGGGTGDKEWGLWWYGWSLKVYF